MTGSSTNTLPEASAASDLLGHQETGGQISLVRIPFAAVLAQVKALSGPGYSLLSDLEADLAWPDGTEARVWGDPVLGNRGVYRKSGAITAGSWTRIGPLPETDLSHSLRVPQGEFINPFPDAGTRANTVPMFDENGQPVAGPTAGDIANAQTHAAFATAARDEIFAIYLGIFANDTEAAAAAGAGLAAGQWYTNSTTGSPRTYDGASWLGVDEGIAKAAQWADTAEDTPVETGPDRFSAKHWAAKAAATSTAVGISYDPAGSVLTGTNLQAAMDEAADLTSVKQDIIPDANSTRDLGSASRAWAEMHGDKTFTPLFRGPTEAADRSITGIAAHYCHLDMSLATIKDSSNTSGITDHGPGNFTVALASAMSSANYGLSHGGGRSTSGAAGQLDSGDYAAESYRANGWDTAEGRSDWNRWTGVIHGVLA